MVGSDGTGAPSAPVTALIGDLSGSRTLSSSRRRQVQNELSEVLERLNRRHAAALLACFVLTLGDEFQGLLSRPQVLPEILWRLRVALPDLRVWIGVGHGTIDTPLREEAVGMDGPAFHRAREALERAKSEGRYGGSFVGFGDDDAILGGLSGLLEVQRHGFTEARVAAIELVRDGASQREVADRLGVTPQAVSKRLKEAHWEAFQAGEDALAELLARYETSGDWPDE